MQRRWNHIPPDVRRRVIRLAAGGATYREILEQVDISSGGVRIILRPLGGVIRKELVDTAGRGLSLDERVEIAVGLGDKLSVRAIARGLGRAPSTVCREIARGGGKDRYRPVPAQHAATERARRPKPTKLAANPALAERVIADLKLLWSPEQIAARLAAEFGDDQTMRVSHETIYKSVYVQGRGELRKELARCLRTGRAKRRRRSRVERRGRIPNMIMISQRPAEVADRAVPGHWEGDLIMGKNNRSAIGTLVERTTRYVMLLHLPERHTAEAVREAMTAKIQTLPAHLARSITWDQGIEMAEHARFTIDTNIVIYFAEPHAPWQRGSNENTNGLARQYFPKGTDLSVYTEADLDAAAASLNGRPRQTLGWMTPSEKLAELVAPTG
jgi:IS30 family transposase